MKPFLLLVTIMLLTTTFSCNTEQKEIYSKQNEFDSEMDQINNHKIEVLNFATFHMGNSSDAHTTEFNEYDEQNKKEVHYIANYLAEFKPTVLVFEVPPSSQEKIRQLYRNYLENPKMNIKNPNEITLLGFELGRLTGVPPEKIYCIDYKSGYGYRKINQMAHEQQNSTYLNYMKFAERLNNEEKGLSTLEKLKAVNTNEILDFLIQVNADILTHVSKDGKNQGAKEAAKFYERNLIMFSNFNQIPLENDDKVFLLMGGAHTAFFRDFINRSPKYNMVNTFDFLK